MEPTHTSSVFYFIMNVAKDCGSTLVKHRRGGEEISLHSASWRDGDGGLSDDSEELPNQAISCGSTGLSSARADAMPSGATLLPASNWQLGSV